MTGRRRIQGRSTIEVSLNQAVGNRSVFWIDEKLGVLLKYVLVSHITGRQVETIELINIHEEPQPAELFKIPGNYHSAELGLQEKPAETVTPDAPAEPHQ